MTPVPEIEATPIPPEEEAEMRRHDMAALIAALDRAIALLSKPLA